MLTIPLLDHRNKKGEKHWMYTELAYNKAPRGELGTPDPFTLQINLLLENDFGTLMDSGEGGP